MNDLGPEAQSILEAARGAESLSRTDRVRIKHAVLLQVATLGAASTAAGGAIAMSVATKVTLLAVTTAVLSGGSVALWAWKAPRVAAPRTHTVSPGGPVVAAPPPTVVEEARLKSLPPEARRRDGFRGDGRRSVAGPAPGIESPSESTAAPLAAPPRALRSPLASLDPELTVLRQAQEDLRVGLPARALRRLAEYDSRFSKGTLDQERRAIEAIALCQVQPGPAARARAESFLRLAPQSPLAGRVRAACKKLDGTAQSLEENDPGREP